MEAHLSAPRDKFKDNKVQFQELTPMYIWFDMLLETQVYILAECTTK